MVSEKTMRLQKYLAHAGLCSRRKAEEYIIKGRVKVNNAVVTELGTKIDPDRDQVVYDDELVLFKKESPNIYIAVNKPPGFITSCSHKNGKIILDLIDFKERIYPVGRLDKESQGLVILTNDGKLHHRLSHPSFNHEKEYIVSTIHPLSKKILKKMEQGVVIDKSGIKTRKAVVKPLSKTTFNIVLKQGKNRQIRKMVTKFGNKVSLLKRVRMANINLGNLKEGKWRHLTAEEIRQLLSAK